MFIWKVWRGESGQKYIFKINWFNRGLPKDHGGIYVMVRRRFLVFFKPLYIGKAADLRSRLMGHERWREAWIHGATERHIMKVGYENVRQEIEEDLIRRYKPKLNDMMVPGENDDGPVHDVKRRGIFGVVSGFSLARKNKLA